MRKFQPGSLILLLGFAVLPVAAQQSAPADDNKIRVYIAYSESREVIRRGRKAWGAGRSHAREGDQPEVADAIKGFHEKCPEITVTENQERANFVLTLQHEQGKGVLVHKNKVILTNRDGDVLLSNSTRVASNSVKDACNAIMKDLGRPAVAK